jgi:hypothetical protein
MENAERAGEPVALHADSHAPKPAVANTSAR